MIGIQSTWRHVLYEVMVNLAVIIYVCGVDVSFMTTPTPILIDYIFFLQ
ncbi:hypothetical protein EMIT019CA3_120048 [Bacillus pseudomycoides]